MSHQDHEQRHAHDRAHDEETPLLRSGTGADHKSLNSRVDQGGEGEEEGLQRFLSFPPSDPEHPRSWPARKKLINVTIIALMAVLSPLASSMFTPGIAQIADDLDTSEQRVIATTTGFVITLGLGPLLWAPLSEDFGRRRLYTWCFTVFAALQVVCAVSPTVEVLIAVRAVSGFFGSVGLANGGGTISDMYEPSERAGVFGWYLLGPLLGPTLGPLFGGVIVTRLGWRWIYWILAIICSTNTAIAFIFLKESYAPVLHAQRKAEVQKRQQEEQDSNNGSPSTDQHRPLLPKRPIPGSSRSWHSLVRKILSSMTRPLRILSQPIVLTMSMYQALIFGTTYSIYTNMQSIYSAPPYNFSSEQIGLLYLGPGLGFLTSVRFLVPRIDTVYNALSRRRRERLMKNQDQDQDQNPNQTYSKPLEAGDLEPVPEFRLPLANVGSVLIPSSLFAFAWTVHAQAPWAVSILATYFYGVGQVVVFNAVQNYYIDAFSAYAASAIAGGSLFRSLVGGVVPLFAPAMFERLGYGWGISVFGFVALAIAPSPLLFYFYGESVRRRFPVRF